MPFLSEPSPGGDAPREDLSPELEAVLDECPHGGSARAHRPGGRAHVLVHQTVRVCLPGGLARRLRFPLTAAQDRLDAARRSDG